MALEFAGKNVLIVDGKSFEISNRTLPDSKTPIRFHRARDDIEGDHPDGKRRRGEEGDCCELRPANTVRPFAKRCESDS